MQRSPVQNLLSFLKTRQARVTFRLLSFLFKILENFHLHIFNIPCILCIFSFLWVCLCFLDNNNGHLYIAFLSWIQPNTFILSGLSSSQSLPWECSSAVCPLCSPSWNRQHSFMIPLYSSVLTMQYILVCWQFNITTYYRVLEGSHSIVFIFRFRNAWGTAGSTVDIHWQSCWIAF